MTIEQLDGEGHWTRFRAFCATFFTRPFGGIELEVFLSTIELVWGLWLMSSTEALASSRPFVLFYDSISHHVVAAPWVLAGLCNAVGIILFFAKNRVCAPLRWSGGFLSALLWAWVGAFTWITAGSAFLIVISGTSIVADVRIMAGAWRRPWPRR